MQRCPKCAQQVPQNALVCPACQALIHGHEFERLSAAAERLEAKSKPRAARDVWLQILPLLPPDSEHAIWVRAHAAELLSQAPESNEPKNQSKWLKRLLGPLGPVAVLLAKAKGVLLALFKLKFLFSFAAFIGVYWALWGPKFGIGFAVLILIHEMGHFIDVKRRGLPAEMPVFLPGLGAYVRWKALGVSDEARAEISLAGPAAGWIASVICVAIWWKTGVSLWAGLARIGAWLNVLNLIPIWVLDGGSAASALGRLERILLLTASLALWLILGENVFFLVAAGATYRLFTKDLPSDPSRLVAAYYLTVLVFLAAILRIVPNQNFVR